MKKQVLATSDESFETVNERVIIMRDESHEWCREWCDHHFVLWSNCRRYSGDRGAESPFYENDNGEQVKRPGVVAFPVSVYDHSGLAYSLGSGAGFPDARWDVTPGALFLWTDKEHYEAMSGEGSWSKVTSEQLAKIAAAEIEEMNMDERGSWYGWRAERRIPWTKTYKDGRTVEGADWEETDSCWVYLTEDVNDIDFPRDIPVFTEEQYLVGDEYEAK